MFRFEVGANILVRQAGWDYERAIEVKILDKVPNRIKAEIVTDGWFKVGEVHWLSSDNWITIGRIKGGLMV